MILKIVSKNFGTQIFPIENYALEMSKHTTLYKCMEFLFYYWLEKNATTYVKDKRNEYYGKVGGLCNNSIDAAIKAAIISLIANIITYEQVKGKDSHTITTNDLLKMKLESNFVLE